MHTEVHVKSHIKTLWSDHWNCLADCSKTH